MKVYITFEKDGYGGMCVDRVFENQSDARVYVLTETMTKLCKTESELMAMCDKQIEIHETIK